MSKGFISPLIISITILALVVIGGAFYLGKFSVPQSQKTEVAKITPKSSPSPMPDETTNPDSIGANWKTYTNEKYSFSFKYPGSWKPESGDEVYNPKYYGGGVHFLTCSTSVFSAEVFDMTKYPSSYSDLESYLKVRGISTTSAKLQTGKNIMLGNEPALYWENPGDPGSSNPSARVILFSDKRKFIIDLNIFNYCGKNLQETSSAFNQIISTFKFLDQEQLKVDLPPLYTGIRWEATKSGRFNFIGGSTETPVNINNVNGFMNEATKLKVAPTGLFGYYYEELTLRGWNQVLSAGGAAEGGSDCYVKADTRYICISFYKEDLPDKPRQYRARVTHN